MQDQVEARAVKKDGESFRVMITTGQDGLLLEGITGLVVGERLSLVLPDGQVKDLAVRWAVGDRAGARIIR